MVEKYDGVVLANLGRYFVSGYQSSDSQVYLVPRHWSGRASKTVLLRTLGVTSCFVAIVTKSFKRLVIRPGLSGGGMDYSLIKLDCLIQSSRYAAVAVVMSRIL